MNFFPLCTARVWPTNSGVIVDRRDHVLVIFFSPAAFMDSTFFIRLPSIKGPFLTDLGTVPSVKRFKPSNLLFYLLFVLLLIIYLLVTLLCLVFFPSGRPQGEHPGRPPDDLPS